MFIINRTETNTGEIELKGQLKFDAYICELPASIGKCRYDIKVLNGKVQLNVNRK